MTDNNDTNDTNKYNLYIKQVELMLKFLKTGAITKAQFDYSYKCLTQKMYPEGIPGKEPPLDNN